MKRKVIAWKLQLSVYLSLVAGVSGFLGYATYMPGSSAPERGHISEVQSRTSEQLREDVSRLSTEFARRNLDSPEVLREVQQYLSDRLASAARTSVVREKVPGPHGDSFNLIAEMDGIGSDEAWVILGAHYDTADHTPGANDNGTGTAALLALATRFAAQPVEKRLRFVLFANEEPPYFQTEAMGSLVHARGCRERGEEVEFMFALETLGYYSDEEGSQKYPPPFGLLYPSEGNFVAFVSNLENAKLVRKSVGAFRQTGLFPSDGAALPGYIPGIGWSDHWSFWQVGYPALMVTDTAPYRDENYHQPSDTVEHLDFEALALVVDGIELSIRTLVREAGL